MKLLLRHEPNQWLSKSMQLSPLVVLTGLKGAGKSTLVRMWLSQENLRGKWHTLKNFLPLSALLGFPELSPESALGKAEDQWREFDIIIWDDIHLLSPHSREMLVSFVQNSTINKAHIFISDEDLAEELPIEIPRRKISGLTESEVHAYLSILDINISETDIKKLIKASGGLPLLIQLWLQDPLKLTDHNIIFKDLNQNEVFILQILAQIKQVVSQQELFSLNLGFEQQQIDHLIKKNLLVIEKNNLILSASVQDLVLSNTDQSNLKKASEIAFLLLKKSQYTRPLEIFISALKSENWFEAGNTIRDVTLEQIENLAIEDLNTLVNWLKQLLPKLTDHDQIFQSYRLIQHGLVLLGDRSEATDFTSHFLFQKKNQYLDSVLFQQLCYENIHWLQRMGKFDQPQELITLIQHRAKPPLSHFLRVEQSLPYVSQDPERALINLHRLEKDLEQGKNTNDLVWAQVYFQIATANNFKEDFVNSRLYYKKSKEKYLSIDRIYFSAFCDFNEAMILLMQRNFSELKSKIDGLKRLTAKYNYQYITAGIELLEGSLCYLNGELQKSLDLINSALLRARKLKAKQALTDLYSQKAVILNFMGLKELAKDSYHEVVSLIGAKSDLVKQLRLELNIDNLTLEEVRDSWPKQNLEALYAYLAERGAETEGQNEKLKLTNRGKLALAQLNLIQKVKKTKEIWTELIELDEILNFYQEARPERVARYCLEASLTKVSDKREILIEKAKLELQRWGADSEIKRPLKAWIQAFKTNSSPLDEPDWLASPLQEQERWRSWFEIISENSSKYKLKTLKGTVATESVDRNFKTKSITIVEDEGLVFKGAKLIEDFQSKPILRQLLIKMIEIFPHAMSKAALAATIWGESYSPLVHDSRIYTSIQRLRKLLSNSAIESWEGGYRWNPKIDFYLYKLSNDHGGETNRIVLLVLESLKKFKNENRAWVKRSDLVEATGSSESTVKRVLSDLIIKNKIQRRGQGPSVEYSLT